MEKPTTMFPQTKYIRCIIQRPRVVDFLGVPLQCASSRNGKDELLTNETDIREGNDSFKIKVEMAASTGEGQEDLMCERTCAIMRTIKSIGFSKLAMKKAFVKYRSANVIIKTINHTTVTDPTLSDSDDCNSDKSAEQRMQHKDTSEEIDIDFGPIAPAMEDESASELMLIEKQTDRNENINNTAPDGNIDTVIQRTTYEHITLQTTEDENNNQTKDETNNQTKHDHATPNISDKQQSTTQAGAIKQIETGEQFLNTAEKRLENTHHDRKQLAESKTIESSVSKKLIDCAVTQILEIDEISGKGSDFKFTVKPKETRETPIEDSSESRKYRKRRRTKSVDTSLTMVDADILNNKHKAKYQIIVARPERKVFFCDLCDMSVHDVLMHKAEHHWF